MPGDVLVAVGEVLRPWGLRGEVRVKPLTDRPKERFEAIIGSMTPDERVKPAIINGSRRSRIAKGSGTQVADVNRLLKQYAQLKQMMKGLKQMQGRMGKFKGAMPFLPR